MNRAKESAQMREHLGADTANTTKLSSPDYEVIRSLLQSGRDVRLLDFPQELRPAVVGIIAQLRDELPIRRSWQTIRESHLSETRLRARRYFIPGEFLREVDHAV